MLTLARRVPLPFPHPLCPLSLLHPTLILRVALRYAPYASPASVRCASPASCQRCTAIQFSPMSLLLLQAKSCLACIEHLTFSPTSRDLLPLCIHLSPARKAPSLLCMVRYQSNSIFATQVKRKPFFLCFSVYSWENFPKNHEKQDYPLCAWLALDSVDSVGVGWYVSSSKRG